MAPRDKVKCVNCYRWPIYFYGDVWTEQNTTRSYICIQLNGEIFGSWLWGSSRVANCRYMTSSSSGVDAPECKPAAGLIPTFKFIGQFQFYFIPGRSIPVIIVFVCCVYSHAAVRYRNGRKYIFNLSSVMSVSNQTLIAINPGNIHQELLG